MKTRYVKTDSGSYLVQIADPKSKWGFYLTDGDQTWDGGFGVAADWVVVPARKVPLKVRTELGWVLRGGR